MTLLIFLVQLAGATMLLLYAVRMVRTGIERAYGASFRRAIITASHPVWSALVGILLAMILQSSAAVALLVAGFSGSGTLAFGSGLAMVLGADLGSALLVQVLSLKLDWLAPVLLALGGLLFLRSQRRGLRQAGRIILGIAFILVALRFLRETMEPVQDSGFLPAVAGYLERDYVTGFLAGTAVAFVLHSSLATVLMCVTVVATGALPLMAGVSLVLGANLGSALIPVWLSRGMEAPARRIPLANLLLRGSGAVLALLALNNLPVSEYLSARFPIPSLTDGQVIVAVHVLFNTMMLVLVPFTGFLQTPMEKIVPQSLSNGTDTPPNHRSVLDDSALETPHLALAGIRREVLRMLQLVEEMITPVMTLYSDYDRDRMQELRACDRWVNDALDRIRRYASRLPSNKMRKRDQRELRELLDYAICVEAAGDIVVKNLLALTEEKAEKRLSFSDEGQKELEALHQRVITNIGLASNVLIANDAESARLLLEEKDEMRRLHRNSRKRHLKRLSSGQRVSLESSDIHLETAHSIKEFNTQIVSVAYPILFREGQLLDTRLINNLDHDETSSGKD